MKNSGLKLHLISLAMLLFMSGCVTVPSEQGAAQKLYTEARQAQASGSYSSAISHFSELKRRHPKSPYGALIPLDLAFAYYKNGEFPLALQHIEEYIAQPPQPASLDYAWYLKGLIQTGLATESNPEPLRNAYQSFAYLAKTFTTSQYQADTRAQMAQLRGQLADHELRLIHTLLQQDEQQRARSRADYLIKNYPESSAAGEARNLFQGTATPAPLAEPARTPWLMQQNPAHFTIQIAGTSSRQQLNTLIARSHSPEQINWFLSPGEEWYTLFYGSYTSQSEAEAAIPGLKSELIINDAWVRQFETLQKAAQP